MCLQTKSTLLNKYNMNFQQQEQQQQLQLQMQQQQQFYAPKKAKKSVRFNQIVHVAPFERASPEEANHIWYSAGEVAVMKANGRELAASYRKLGPSRVNNNNNNNDDDDDEDYRGFEGYTPLRQRQRLLSNRCAVYAHKQGLDADATAAMYQRCNEWSANVAFVQAIHDFVGTFGGDDSSRTMMMRTIPSVAAMIPPPDLPFAVRGFFVLQSQRKSKLERQLKRRSATANIRRVRQRIC